MINFMGPSNQMANMYMRSRMPRYHSRQKPQPAMPGNRAGGNIMPMPGGNTGIAGGLGMPQVPIGPSPRMGGMISPMPGGNTGFGGGIGLPNTQIPGMGEVRPPMGDMRTGPIMPPPNGGFVPYGGDVRPGDLSSGPIGAAYKQGRFQTLGGY